MNKEESDKYKIALTKVMVLCSKREYCNNDIREKIRSCELDNNQIERIISTLEKENFLNESRYCQAFVRDKFRYNKWGKNKIKAHLKAKKIPVEKIEKALCLLDNEHYIQTLKEMLTRHRKMITAKNQYDLKGKLMRYGLSKGFESNLLYDILNEI